MSYSVDVRTRFGPVPNIGVTTFYGGTDRGRCVQITVGHEYAQLTPEELADLREVLEHAADRSLMDHEGCNG